MSVKSAVKQRKQSAATHKQQSAAKQSTCVVSRKLLSIRICAHRINQLWLNLKKCYIFCATKILLCRSFSILSILIQCLHCITLHIYSALFAVDLIAKIRSNFWWPFSLFLLKSRYSRSASVPLDFTVSSIRSISAVLICIFRGRGLDRVSKAVLGVWLGQGIQALFRCGTCILQLRLFTPLGAWIGYPRLFWGYGIRGAWFSLRRRRANVKLKLKLKLKLKSTSVSKSVFVGAWFSRRLSDII